MVTPHEAAGAAASAEAPPRRGRPGYDRDRLIEVCVDVFNRHGYDATSMGLLAQHLGISKSAIYHHVESKEEILEQALGQALDSLEASFDEALARHSEPRERLEAALRGTIETLVAEMPSVTLLLRLRGNSEVELAAMERRRVITRRLGALIEQAQAVGAARQDVGPRNLARLALGMINSLVDWYRPGGGHPGDKTVEQMTDAVTGVVLSGLRG